jgi:hypothetical protein
VAYAIAMAYVESAVVVYLDAAVHVRPEAIFPLQNPASVGNLGAIEVGRELATLVMLAAVGMLAGHSRLEALAWTAVAFGAWDIGYYGWLWVFAGWPPGLGTWDLLFLIPVPWTGPVWAPVTVSVALVVFGLAAARRLRRGVRVRPTRRHVLAAVAGGILVILSFTLDAGSILAGGIPVSYPWPIFAAGMAMAAGAAAAALRTPGEARHAFPRLVSPSGDPD